MIPEIDILVEADGWPETDKLRILVEEAIAATAVNANLKWTENAELSLLFTDDTRQAEINGKWRGKPVPTNVLSFPGDNIGPGQMASQFIGDLAFSLQTVCREAKEQQKSFDHHLTHLCVHGFLHLFGYDHIEEEDAEKMEALERRVLFKLGIDDPYTYLDSQWSVGEALEKNIVTRND